MGFTHKSKPLCEDTWLIEADGCTCYLVKGEREALLIDNGYGVHNIRRYAEQLAGMPVAKTADTHGHFDHAGGNGFFDTVYLAEAAVEGATTPYPSFAGQSFKLKYPMVFVGDGNVIDLGGRALEVISIPSHSPGDIALLDRKHRILFAGDNVSPGRVTLMYFQEDPQPTIETYARHMEKLLAYRDAFDHICRGHGHGFDNADLVERLLQNAKHIMAGHDGDQMHGPDFTNWKEGDKGPRPGDFVMYLPEYKRVMKYAGVELGYDNRYVFDRKD